MNSLNNFLLKHKLIDNILAATINHLGIPIAWVLAIGFYATIIRGIWLIWA